MGIIDKIFRKNKLSSFTNPDSGFLSGADYNPFAKKSAIEPYLDYHPVRACINILLNLSAKAELTICHKGDEAREPVTDCPLQPIFDIPRIKKATESHYLYSGECFWLLEDEGRRYKFQEGFAPPTKARIIPAKEMDCYVDKETNELLYWEHLNPRTNRKTKYSSDEVIHIFDSNPINPLRGLSKILIQSITNIIEMDYASIVFNRDFFKNNAIPLTLIKYPKNTPPATAKAGLDHWQDVQSTGRRLAYTIGDTEYKEVGVSQRDMDFKELRQMSINEICDIFSVGRSMYGNVSTTYNNILTEKMNTWDNAVIPMQMLIADTLNTTLFARYAPEYECYYDVSNIEELQATLGERLDNALKLKTQGYTRNEINRRCRLGMPEDKTGDIRPGDDIKPIEVKSVKEGEGVVLPSVSKVKEKSSADYVDDLSSVFYSKLKKYVYHLRSHLKSNPVDMVESQRAQEVKLLKYLTKAYRDMIDTLASEVEITYNPEYIPGRLRAMLSITREVYSSLADIDKPDMDTLFASLTTQKLREIAKQEAICLIESSTKLTKGIKGVADV